MKIELSFNYTVDLADCKLDSLTSAFKAMLAAQLSTFISSVLQQFADRLLGSMADGLPAEAGQLLVCPGCGGRSFKWKTRMSSSVSAKLTTAFGTLSIPQMQIQCRECARKQYIVRKLLKLLPYARLSEQMEHQLALCGSLTSFRVSEVFARTFGASFRRSTVWRCVRKVGRLLDFSVSPDERGEAQADGTGIPINGISKRGRELKVLIQKNTDKTAKETGSRWRVAGLDLGPYNGSWEKLIARSREAIRTFKTFLLTTDGDDSIRKGLGNLKILFQRCLWHIPHQLKHCLWQDKIARDDEVWQTIMGGACHLVALRPHLEDDEKVAFVRAKEKELGELLDFCRTHECEKSAAYLENAGPDLFTAVQNSLHGKSTSQAERVMRTVNLRVDFGKWSEEGVLNAMKIRLAFYYNGYDPSRNMLKPK
ncbi:MAG: hypothetical protein ACOX6W_18295 [Lentisphaeria bacterium]